MSTTYDIELFNKEIDNLIDSIRNEIFLLLMNKDLIEDNEYIISVAKSILLRSQNEYEAIKNYNYKTGMDKLIEELNLEGCLVQGEVKLYDVIEGNLAIFRLQLIDRYTPVTGGVILPSSKKKTRKNFK